MISESRTGCARGVDGSKAGDRPNRWSGSSECFICRDPTPMMFAWLMTGGEMSKFIKMPRAVHALASTRQVARYSGKDTVLKPANRS